MSIFTNNQITRGIKKAFHGAVWPYKNRGKLILLTSAFLIGAMGYSNIKSLDACELATLDLKNANRTITTTPEETAYKNHAIGQSTAFIADNCPTSP